MPTDATNFIGGVEIVPFTADCIVVSPVVSVESSRGVADALFEILVYEPPPSFATTTYVYVLSVTKLFTVNVVVLEPVEPISSKTSD